MTADTGPFSVSTWGTTNIKAQVVADDGAILSSGAAPVGVRYSPGGAAEQDIEEIWSSTVKAVRAATGGNGGSRAPWASPARAAPSRCSTPRVRRGAWSSAGRTRGACRGTPA